MALVVDASVGLKWVLNEPDSDLAEALVRAEPDLLVPDFWLNEAANVLWLQVRRKLFTPTEATEALALLRAQIEPTPTAGTRLHEVALVAAIENGASSPERPT
jgi:predicted nucleic acid-binding protein